VDIRWRQRFSNYGRALDKLVLEADYLKKHQGEWEPLLVDMAREGLVQSFEFTHELAWNVMKDYIAYQGNDRVRGSRDATREAFAMQLIEDGQGWMDMIKSRNETSHTYDNETAETVVDSIMTRYIPLFVRFKTVMEEIAPAPLENAGCSTV